MRVAFFGTPAVAVPALEALVDAHGIDVVLVVTNPDRPRGRGRRLVAPPVKEAAVVAGLEVRQPERAREIRDELAELDVHACAVVAYGALLPADVLAAGGHGFVNLHFSLLPRWRGAAPVQHAIRAGDEVTGITTFVLDEGMDTGPVLRREEVAIGPRESAGSLLGRLAVLGAPVLVESVRALADGEVPVPQPTAGVTLAPKVTPADVALDFAADAADLDRLVRSADPAPGAHTRFRGGRLKVWGARPVEATGTPGEVISRDRAGVVVACGTGALLLESVQPEGRARMDGAGFANGYQPQPGERFGDAADGG